MRPGEASQRVAQLVECTARPVMSENKRGVNKEGIPELRHIQKFLWHVILYDVLLQLVLTQFPILSSRILSKLPGVVSKTSRCAFVRLS